MYKVQYINFNVQSPIYKAQYAECNAQSVKWKMKSQFTTRKLRPNNTMCNMQNAVCQFSTRVCVPIMQWTAYNMPNTNCNVAPRVCVPILQCTMHIA